MIWQRVKKLRAAGVVGINQRNRNYVMAVQPRRLYARVDDKVHTKQLASAAGIAVPALYGLVSSVRDAHHFAALVAARDDFVIKPAHGSGGNGILVITERRRNHYVRADGSSLTLDEIEHHIHNILGGIYSLGGQPDQAIIEYRVGFDPVFDPISFRGVPDIQDAVVKTSREKPR